jgi:hypothetical protein
MTDDNTKESGRQIQKVPPVPFSHLSGRLYFTKQGERFAVATYLGTLPKKGLGGRKVADSDTKQAANLRRSMKKLKGMIRANFGIDLDCEAHITLTYKGRMYDTNRLQENLEKFLRLMRKHYADHSLEYIAIMEPHAHGGWHIHLLLKSDKPLWLSNGVEGISFDRVRNLWRKANGSGHGGTYHARLPDDVRDFGAYFAAYFTTAIPEVVELSGNREEIKKASKAAEKGSRLRFYPANFKFYRASLGIIRPKSTEKFVFQVEKEYGNPVHTTSYAVTNESDSEKRIQFIQLMEFQKKQ